MEFVAGQPIDRWCDAKRLDVRGRVERVLELVGAVASAHRNLIVHRDIKPANALVTDAGQVKLLDFGIAKILHDESDGVATATGLGALTPKYASPEQLTGAPITTATDVYQLGLLLYELLVGRRPFHAEETTLPRLARAVTEHDAPSCTQALRAQGDALAAIARARSSTPERLRRQVGGDLQRVILKALARDPASRYDSAALFGEDLRRALDGRPVQAAPTRRGLSRAPFRRAPPGRRGRRGRARDQRPGGRRRHRVAGARGAAPARPGAHRGRQGRAPVAVPGLGLRQRRPRPHAGRTGHGQGPARPGAAAHRRRTAAARCRAGRPAGGDRLGLRRARPARRTHAGADGSAGDRARTRSRRHARATADRGRRGPARQRRGAEGARPARRGRGPAARPIPPPVPARSATCSTCKAWCCSACASTRPRSRASNWRWPPCAPHPMRDARTSRRRC